MAETKTYTSVADAVEEITGDQDFADEVRERLRSRDIIKALVGKRVAAGISQAEVAKVLGCTQSRISKIENAFDADLTLDHLAAYAKVLGREIHMLFTERNQGLAERVKFHVLQAGRALSKLVEMVRDDDAMAQGVAKLHIEALVNFVRLIQQTSEQLPICPDNGEPYLKIAEVERETPDDADEVPPLPGNSETVSV